MLEINNIKQRKCSVQFIFCIQLYLNNYFLFEKVISMRFVVRHSFVSMILAFQKNYSLGIIEIFEVIDWMISYFKVDGNETEKRKLIDCLLDGRFLNS